MRIERLPLNALRAFAEAAREGSFKTAASRLGVTPGAVSRQVKQLEARLGIVLFERHANGVYLNEAGRQLAVDVDAGLERIAAGVKVAGERSRAATTLSLSAPPSFTQLWLLPRLAEFESMESHVEISLDASQTFIAPTWQGEGARIAIRYGRGPWPGVQSQMLFGDKLFPVCAPTLLTHGPRLTEPADLANHTLLEVAWDSRQGEDFPGWREWLDAAGVQGVVTPTQRRYSLFGLALDQAIAGRGVMLASHPIVADRLTSGVLVRPFGSEYVLTSPFTYELVLPATGNAPPTAQRFIEWLTEEAERFRQEALSEI